MSEDDYLVETAHWARYYERAREIVNDARAAGIATEPPKEVIDNPEAFNRWVRECEQVHMTRMEGG